MLKRLIERNNKFKAIEAQRDLGGTSQERLLPTITKFSVS